MKETLRAGVKVVSAPQLFPTPPELAERVIAAADIPGRAIAFGTYVAVFGTCTRMFRRFAWTS
jgi:hypothetical protein